jgi:hypothetical protein
VTAQSSELSTKLDCVCSWHVASVRGTASISVAIGREADIRQTCGAALCDQLTIYDVVGEIDQLGDGMRGFQVGDRVADLTVVGSNAAYRTRAVHRRIDPSPSLPANCGMSAGNGFRSPSRRHWPMQ